jgi:hypothetical protein
MIENDITQHETDIDQEELNAEEATKSIEEEKTFSLLKYEEDLKVLITGRMNFLEREPNESGLVG